MPPSPPYPRQHSHLPALHPSALSCVPILMPPVAARQGLIFVHGSWAETGNNMYVLYGSWAETLYPIHGSWAETGVDQIIPPCTLWQVGRDWESPAKVCTWHACIQGTAHRRYPPRSLAGLPDAMPAMRPKP